MKNAINFSKDDIGSTSLLVGLLLTISVGLLSSKVAVAEQVSVAPVAPVAASATVSTPHIETLVVTATRLK